MRSLPRYVVTEKRVGETPLVALERARHEHDFPVDTPLTYAGRLDPMASGALLILVGEECKKQRDYHTLDKEYEVELLFGVSSDTADVLGIVASAPHAVLGASDCRRVLGHLRGPITLQYPHFSSKTVRGKPLHTWTLERRLNEIDVPVKDSMIHKVTYGDLKTVTREEVLKTVRAKIETIPFVTDPEKALGADFRRDRVRASWNTIEAEGPSSYQILSFTCIASSGTYMRSLCELIAKRLGATGLAYSIHRTKIGRYRPLYKGFGLWMKRF
jgi:tRNA pseudouridine(55) synthase